MSTYLGMRVTVFDGRFQVGEEDIAAIHKIMPSFMKLENDKD